MAGAQPLTSEEAQGQDVSFQNSKEFSDVGWAAQTGAGPAKAQLLAPAQCASSDHSIAALSTQLPPHQDHYWEREPAAALHLPVYPSEDTLVPDLSCAAQPDGSSGGTTPTAVALARVDSIEVLLDSLVPEAAVCGGSSSGKESLELESAEFDWVEGVPERLEGVFAWGWNGEGCPAADSAMGLAGKPEEGKPNPHASFMSFLKAGT